MFEGHLVSTNGHAFQILIKMQDIKPKQKFMVLVDRKTDGFKGEISLDTKK